MVKKKLSGQTIAIIILSILLLLAICFGGVFAFYTAHSGQVYGRIKMAVLNLNLKTGTDASGASQLFVSNGLYVPGQSLHNTPLIIENYSNTNTYMVVVYKVETDSEIEGYDDSKPLIDIGLTDASPWVDYLFVNHDGSVRVRCLVTKNPVAGVENAEQVDQITVIAEDKLRIPTYWGNGYMGMNISFAFQAFAIGADTFSFNEETALNDRCAQIVSAIYTDNSQLSIWR